jgi:hypothetical protein
MNFFFPTTCVKNRKNKNVFDFMFTSHIHERIKLLVSLLNTTNSDSNLISINQLLKMYQDDDRTPFIVSLLDEIDGRDSRLSNSKDDQKVLYLL